MYFFHICLKFSRVIVVLLSLSLSLSHSLKFSVMKTYFSRCSSMRLPFMHFYVQFKCLKVYIQHHIQFSFSSALLSCSPELVLRLKVLIQDQFLCFYIFMTNPRSTFYRIVWDNTTWAVSSSSNVHQMMPVSTSQRSLCLWLACSVSAGFTVPLMPFNLHKHLQFDVHCKRAVFESSYRKYLSQSGEKLLLLKWIHKAIQTLFLP